MLKRKDLLVLSFLRNNARQTVTGISRKTGIPATTIYDQLRRHEKRFITRYASLLKFSELGYNVKVYIAIQVDKSDKERLRRFLQGHLNINSFYEVNSGYDFLVEALFKNSSELGLFIEQLDSGFSLLKKVVLPIVCDIEKEKFLSRQDQLDALYIS